MTTRRTLAQIADRTMATPIRVWGFGVGGALAGLVRVGELLDDSQYVDAVAELVAPSLTAAPDPTDHLISVEALHGLAAVRPDIKIDDACERWMRAVLDAPHARADGPRPHRPDLPSWSSTVWVDCMHTDGPGLAALGKTDAAVTYAAEYAAALQRDDGLFHHGYDVDSERGNGVAWGRGQAWALLGLVETLRVIDDDGLRLRLQRLAESIAAHEDDGRWHTIVDEPDSPIENSVAAYVGDGLGRAVSLGLVDEAFHAIVARASDTTLASLDDGGLTVSEATPVGGETNYVTRSVGVYPWGQAPVLHALADRIEAEAAR